MLNQFSRTSLLLGDAAMERLCRSRVAVFGVGGVGSFAVEALARSGVGALDLIDDDLVCVTNINRQLIATLKTIGRHKTDVAKDRVLEINPRCDVRVLHTFFLPETSAQFRFEEYDYVIDAVDTVTAKLALAEACANAHVPLISAMGAGNKLDPSRFRVADLYETSVCPLARVMRRECKKRGITRLKVVYSDEQTLRPAENALDSCRYHCVCPEGAARKCTERRDIPGSVSFVPSVCGLILAGEVIKDLINGTAVVL